MKFCSKCNSILKPVGNSRFVCISCNNIEEGELTSIVTLKKNLKKGSGIIEDKDIFADHDFLCKNCGHTKAQIIMKGPQVSDEDDPVYLKCGKCKKTQQLARKIN